MLALVASGASALAQTKTTDRAGTGAAESANRGREKRHGGDGGGTREPCRGRNPRARRQRGRCRGRGGFCARRHISECGQYRRRRFHADAARGGKHGSSPSIIARPRRSPRRKIFFWTRAGEADPKKSREEGLAVGVPGTVAGLSWRSRNTARENSRLPNLAPAIKLAREGFPVSENLRIPRKVERYSGALGPRRSKIFLRGWVGTSGKAIFRAIRSCRHDGKIARKGRQDFIRGGRGKDRPRACKPRAAI